MEYDGVNNVVCDAEESDWLDISYTERKYVDKPKKKWTFNPKWKRPLIIAAVAFVAVAAFVGLLLVDSDFQGNVFETARATYSTVISWFSGEQQQTANKINVPANATVTDVTDGVTTFGGGRAVLSFTEGKVTDVTENTVTVSIDDNTSIVYGSLTAVYVSKDDAVTVNALIGKYDGSATATIIHNGEVVQNVVGSENNIQWSV